LASRRLQAEGVAIKLTQVEVRRLLDVVGGFDEGITQQLSAHCAEQDTLLRATVERLYRLTIASEARDDAARCLALVLDVVRRGDEDPQRAAS